MIHRIKQLTAKAIEHKGLRKYGANMSWLFVEKAVRMVIGFTVGIYVARQLGPAKYGILNYAISFAAIFSFLVSLGMDQIMVRELVKFPEKRDELMGTSLLLRLAGYIIMLGGIWGGLSLSNNDMNTNLIVLVIAAGYLFQIFQTIDFYFQAHVLSKYVAISQMTAWIIISALRAVFAYLNLPLLFFAYLEAGNIILTSLGYLIFYILKADSIAKWRYKTATAKFLLKNSWPLMLSSMIGIIYLRIDQVMIMNIRGAGDNGIYSSAVRLCQLWYFLPALICSSFFPAVIRASGKKDVMKNKLMLLYGGMFWLGFFIALPASIFHCFIIESIYGVKYVEAGPVLAVYIWSLVFILLGAPTSQWILIKNLQKITFVSASLSTLVNVVLNYYLINYYGPIGAAIATLIAQMIPLLFFYFMYPPTKILLEITLKGIFRPDKWHETFS